MESEKPQIRAIITDVGGVLARFDAFRFYKTLAQAFGTTVGRVAGLRVDGESSAKLIDAFCRGDIDILEVQKIFERNFNVAFAIDEFFRLWRSGFIGLYHDVFCAIRKVRRRYNLRVVSCTNVDPIYGITLRGPGEPFDHYFDAEVQSWQVGALKPEQRMYEEAVRAAQVLPDQCLFIDDVRENVVAARRFGLQAIDFTGDVLRLRDDFYQHGLGV